MSVYDALLVLKHASVYLADQHPFVRNDVYNTTPERRACKILIALCDLLELTQ